MRVRDVSGMRNSVHPCWAEVQCDFLRGDRDVER